MGSLFTASCLPVAAQAKKTLCQAMAYLLASSRSRPLAQAKRMMMERTKSTATAATAPMVMRHKAPVRPLMTLIMCGRLKEGKQYCG